MGVSRSSKKRKGKRSRHAPNHQQPPSPTKKQVRAVNRELNLGGRVTIPINAHGCKIRLPGGFSTEWPSRSVIRLPKGGLITPVDNDPVDLILHGRVVHSAAPYARVVLHGDAIFRTCNAQRIELPGGVTTTALDLPPGTLLQFGAEAQTQRTFTLGTRIFDLQVTLRDYVLVEGQSPMNLSASVTLGPAGLTLEQDTTFPHPLLLTGTVLIQEWTALPGTLILDESGPLNIVMDGMGLGNTFHTVAFITVPSCPGPQCSLEASN